jgi:hypothetical protein
MDLGDEMFNLALAPVPGPCEELQMVIRCQVRREESDGR